MARQTKRSTFWIQVGLGALLGAFFLGLAQRPRTYSDDWWFAAWIAAAYICFVVHEAGHALAAQRLGFRLYAFAVAPLKFVRQRSGWKISFWVSLTPAFVVVYPTDAHDIRRRFRRVITAGPVASLFLSAAAAAVWWFDAQNLASFPRMTVAMVAGLSLVIGVIGFVPIRQRSCVSDGVRFWMLRRDTPQSRRICAMLLLASAILAGKRPREWDRTLVDAICDETDDPGLEAERNGARGLRYNWLIDMDQLDDAQDLLQTIVADDHPELLKAIWIYQVAWFKAFYVRDLGAAKAWFSRVTLRKKKPIELQIARDQAEAAIACLERRWDDAEAAARRAIGQCDQIVAVASGNQVKEKLALLMEEIRKGRDAASLVVSNRK